MEPPVTRRAGWVAGLLAWAAFGTGCESIFGIGDLPLPNDAGAENQDSGAAESGPQNDGAGLADRGGVLPDGPVPIDSTTPADGPAPTDGSGNDSTSGGDSGPTGCYAATPFTPFPWAPPSAFPDPACTSAQIAGYLACFPNCSTFRSDPNNAACMSCIETDVGAAAHGPVITSGGVPVEVNFGGCQAHQDGNPSAGSCGNEDNNANDCANAECSACADFASPQPGGATAQCEALAFGTSGSCSADQVPASCTSELRDGGTAASCGSLGMFLGSWCGGSTCTAVSVAPIPPNGGASCPQGTSATCWPQDETFFSPTWVPPLGAHLNECTPAQVSGFYTACLDAPTSTTTTCNAWTQSAANTTCFGCLYTDSTAARYGALIAYSQAVVINTAGCIALAEPCNTQCAQAISALSACEDNACGSTLCPDYASYSTCASEADSCTACGGYATAANCSSSITGATHPAAAACNVAATTAQAAYTSVATFMCGM
jgi:hypothetical protein